MRAYQVFARMPSEDAAALFHTLSEQTPAAWAQGLGAASAALKARPVYLQRLPFERRAEAVRRALSRVAANELAEELLAVYFLECRRPLLVEWLDRAGVEHEEGTLSDAAPPSPSKTTLRKAVSAFRDGGNASEHKDRELLLRAFAAQEAVDWPELDALLEAAA